MNEGLIAARYAKALFGYAQGAGLGERFYQYMTTLNYNYMTHHNLRHVLSNPILEINRKHELICEAAGVGGSAEFGRFVDLVLSNRRESCFQSIALLYIDMYDDLHGISEVQLTVADSIDSGVRERLSMLARGAKSGRVQFKTKIDPAIVGGFIFQIGTYRLDASVRSQLESIKRQFVEKNKRVV